MGESKGAGSGRPLFLFARQFSILVSVGTKSWMCRALKLMNPVGRGQDLPDPCSSARGQ